MNIGVLKETCAGERRVACVPATVEAYKKLGASVLIEQGAGRDAGFPDQQFVQAGATVKDRAAVLRESDVLLQVRCYGANPARGGEDLGQMHAGQLVVGHGEPLTVHEQTRAMAERGVTFLAMELIPRITRAQAMDSLSSQANLAGYKAVLMAAVALGRVFPMMMTAAGTVTPARVLVMGAGVAGLQAIATARRLGAVVSATDVRAAVKEQVESLGARFLTPPSTSEGEGGYAKEQTEAEKEAQRKMIISAVAESDVVVTTAAIPGRKAPVLVTAEMVRAMKPGSVIVDLAAERGGNCELTEPDQTVEKHGVTIIGTANVPATIAHDASLTYARNLVALLKGMIKDGKLVVNMSDEVVRESVVTMNGQVVHPRVRQAMGLEALQAVAPPSAGGAV